MTSRLYFVFELINCIYFFKLYKTNRYIKLTYKTMSNVTTLVFVININFIQIKHRKIKLVMCSFRWKSVRYVMKSVYLLFLDNVCLFSQSQLQLNCNAKGFATVFQGCRNRYGRFSEQWAKSFKIGTGYHLIRNCNILSKKVALYPKLQHLNQNCNIYNISFSFPHYSL